MSKFKNNKLLVICGPTATGKTRLALRLAGKFPAEIISADSRQVYRGMDIGTGKDTPTGVKIRGYDLVDPKEGFSVAQYRDFALPAIRRFWAKGRLPILVGGTGLYIKSIVDGINTVTIPQNRELRRMLKNKSPEELFESLAQMDAIKAASLNSSDKLNSRRLERAIEVATWKIDNKAEEEKLTGINLPGESMLSIGLAASDNYLFQAVKNRVQKRIGQGLEAEIKRLLKSGVTWENQAMSSLGYKEWQRYLLGRETKEELISKWEKAEIKYVKRQLTWFKTDRRINWFDISKNGYEEKVEKMVKKWYYSS